MIRDYSNHAANERTFLAWVRTGIAVVAFGFVIEKFNFFVATIASSALGETAHRSPFEQLLGPFGPNGGLALIFGGVAVIVLATVRFVRTTWLLDHHEEYSVKSVRLELILSAGLVLLIATYSVYLSSLPADQSVKATSHATRQLMFANPCKLGAACKSVAASTVI